MSRVNKNFIERVEVLEKFISDTSFRLKKVYRLTGPKINLFWEEVWNELSEKKDTDITIEQVVKAKIKSLGRKK